MRTLTRIELKQVVSSHLLSWCEKREEHLLRTSSSHQNSSEVHANDLLLHSSVRWLSTECWNAFDLFKRKHQLFVLLKSQAARQFLPLIARWEKNACCCYLVCIMSHLNELNLKLQGKNKSVCDSMTVTPSRVKLEGFKEVIKRECVHFPKVQNRFRGCLLSVQTCW